jgi:hypothetical protein
VNTLTSGDCRYFATCILEAWQQQDFALFRSGLNQISAIPVTEQLTSEERERIDLLRGIASEMGGIAAHGDSGEARVYLGLLRHLASTPARM